MKANVIKFYFILFLPVFFLSGCSESNKPDPAPVKTIISKSLSSVNGQIPNMPIAGAEIKLHRFDSDGIQVEILADNAPVLTSADGGFDFKIDSSNVPAGMGVLVISTVDGILNSQIAPTLSAVIIDSSALNNNNGEIRQYLSTASTISAGVLINQINQLESSLSKTDANQIITRVEQELSLDLSEDPSLLSSGVITFYNNIMTNLSVNASPENTLAINEFLEYVILNICSSTKQLDTVMFNPLTGTDATSAASFENIGDGLLATLISGGPSEYIAFKASLDKSSIENDGLDTTQLNINLIDATNNNVPDGTEVKLETSIGRLILSKSDLKTTSGKVWSNISSVWEGEAEISATYAIANDMTLKQVISLTVQDNQEDTIDTEMPRLSNAGSTSSNEIVVSFSEPMRGGLNNTENPAFYRITKKDDHQNESVKLDAEDSNPFKHGKFSNKVKKAGNSTVVVVGAELILPDRRSVRLTTLSQSDLQYKLTVTNMTDLAGNPMAPADILVDPSTVYFQGTAPSGDEVVDTDGDGLSDHDEQVGWPVYVVMAGGETVTIYVTSDPMEIDTDGDGVPDNEELHGGLNPRSADSDGDTLTDNQEWNTIFSNGLDQDTDGDGVQDGFEYYTFRTSPILADTDGDQISDPDEVSAGNRNPLVADLPSPRIAVGSVNLQLNTTFSYTDEAGMQKSVQKSSETILTRGEEDKTSQSKGSSTKSTIENSQEIEVGVSVKKGIPTYSGKATAGFKQGSERGSTFAAGKESTKNSEEAYHDSLTTNVARDFKETVTREIDSASIKAFVTIDSLGDIPFTISNLELSVQSQSPNDRRNIIPIASLVPENSNLESINIGTLGDTARGPFVFATATQSVFPGQIEELMKSPRGLMVQLANFDITDEEGTNFSFSSQDVLDRTAGISFDSGNSDFESYRIATASAHNPANGVPLGVTMEYALNVIGLQRFATIRDGGNGIVDTSATGDDEQMFALDDAIEPGVIIITAGINGIIDTVSTNDDQIVDADYESTIREGSDVIVDGGNGIVETVKEGDDVQVLFQGQQVSAIQVIIYPGENGILDSDPLGDDQFKQKLAPHKVLTKFKNVESNISEHRFWALFESQSPLAVDLDNKVLRAGESYAFSYVQDKDSDGVWASEEALHGSSDNNPNTDSCVSSTREKDSNCDFLDDKVEIQDGWSVKLASSPQSYKVYPNPVQGDSDRDGLFDDQEQKCQLDPRLRDSDLDGLSDYEELTGKIMVDGIEGLMESLDPDTNDINYTILPYSGNTNIQEEDGELNTDHDALTECTQALREFEGALFSGYATNPLNADTDHDLVSDALELRLGLNPNNPNDGPLYLDDDKDGVPNLLETTSRFIVVNLNSNAPNDGNVSVRSDPQNADSDGDQLPDLLEWYIGSNPDSLDTDGDGLSDFNEYKDGGQACVGVSPRVQCKEWIDNTFGKSYPDFLIACQSADACDLKAISDSLRNSDNIGSNLNEQDTDLDSLDDNEELSDFTLPSVNGSSVYLNAPVSSWSDADTDNDGINDGYEISGTSSWNPTDPDNPDTDGDDRDDGLEIQNHGTDPTFANKRIEITSTEFNVTKSDDDGCCDNGADLVWNAYIRINSESRYRQCSFGETSLGRIGSWTNQCQYFIGTLDKGDRIRVIMEAYDEDPGPNEGCNSVTLSFDYDNTSDNSTKKATHTCGDDLNFTTTLTVDVF